MSPSDHLIIMFSSITPPSSRVIYINLYINANRSKVADSYFCIA